MNMELGNSQKPIDKIKLNFSFVFRNPQILWIWLVRQIIGWQGVSKAFPYLYFFLEKES